MHTEKIKIILNELLGISKDFKAGVDLNKFKIKFDELENYDFEIYSELSKIDGTLSSEKSTSSNYEKVCLVPLLEIENEFILFYPSVIKRYKLLKYNNNEK